MNDKKTTNPIELYTMEETSKIFKIHPITLTRWIKRKKIQVVKIGKSVLFTRQEIDNLINKNSR